MTDLIVVAGALAGGFVSGLAGFGTGLVAIGIWLHVVSPEAAATLSLVCSVVAQTQTIRTVWHAIDRARVWPMLAAGLLGVPVGTRLLTHVDPVLFHIMTGVFLLAFSIFMLLYRRPTRIAWGGRRADAFVGFFGGLLGGLAGLSGPLPTIWATLRGWSKDERRGVFQAFNLTILAAALVSHAFAGEVTVELGRLTLVALPGTLLGSVLGVRLYARLSDRHFNSLVLALIGVSGITLLWAELV